MSQSVKSTAYIYVLNVMEISECPITEKTMYLISYENPT